LSRLLCLGDSELREKRLRVAVVAVNAEVVAGVTDKPWEVEAFVDIGELRVACKIKVSEWIYACLDVRTCCCWLGWLFALVVGGAGRWRSRNAADLLGPPALAFGKRSGLRLRFGVGLRSGIGLCGRGRRSLRAVDL
jgi:hypothetical protein